MAKTVQAKHIADGAVLEVIDRIDRELGRWTLVSELEVLGFPTKVLLAKMAGMIRRKVVKGCACGCYGGFERVPQ